MKKTILKSACGALALLAAGTLGVSQARAEKVIPFTYKMPVHVTCNINEVGCDNSGGPQITLGGEISVGGLGANLILQNNKQGTHQLILTNWVTNIVLVAEGGAITIPKQPPLGGVGGNPYIFMQFYDSKGHALTDEMFLGRCVQGLSLGADFLNDVAGALTATSDGCLNHPGPRIYLGGEFVLSGLKARIIFKGSITGAQPHQAVRYGEFDIIIDGTPVTVPKSPHQGGAGGNPLVYVQLLACTCPGKGASITPSDPILLGRCNKI